MLAEIKKLVKQHKDTIYLGLIMFLVAMLAFALGWIFSQRQTKTPLEFNQLYTP